MCGITSNYLPFKSASSGRVTYLVEQGVPLEGRFNVWLKAFVAGAVGGFLFKLLWLVTCISSLVLLGFVIEDFFFSEGGWSLTLPCLEHPLA